MDAGHVHGPPEAADALLFLNLENTETAPDVRCAPGDMNLGMTLLSKTRDRFRGEHVSQCTEENGRSLGVCYKTPCYM